MADEHTGHHVNYLMVFGALCVFTLLSWLADVQSIIESKVAIAVIVLAVAAAKASCVMAFFMHLKFEGRWKYILLAPTIILAVGLPLALLPDIGVHYYRIDVPQMQEYRHDHHAAETGYGVGDALGYDFGPSLDS